MVLASHYAETTPEPGEQIRVRGLVQGVGFRPTVWRIANECNLVGSVLNDAHGVFIAIWGEPADRQRFIRRLTTEAPPLARIDNIESKPLARASPTCSDSGPGSGSGSGSGKQFRIIASENGEMHTGIAPDAGTCIACLSEVLDPQDRRHGYAFTNCTHCGPRLSIVAGIPYDRANTSMAAFSMCASCQQEYEDPANRRFHAQPNACPDCGPGLWLEALGQTQINTRKDPLTATAKLLNDGGIVAIKGIGGIHLACDASQTNAVNRLRKLKRRPDKPLALLARDAHMIRRYCHLSATELELLQSPAAPIVLLDTHGQEMLAPGVAPRQKCYGFMLPYSPLHHLLMAGRNTPLVLTSGNLSDEPQCISNQQARNGLAGIADALLLNDREILNRVDDSVARVIAGTPALLRRARGYSPASIRLPAGFEHAPPLLALGGELKNTFCLLKDGEAIISQHMGDLENASANRAYQDGLQLYQGLYQHQPQALGIDRHPEYLASKLGRAWAGEQGLPLIETQHHHAHIAACMADNGIELNAAPILGIALDGTGFGDDASLWGGEFLSADYRGYTRVATLAEVPMPGSTQAIRQPWRMAYAHLRRLGDWDELAREYANLPIFRSLAQKPLKTLDGMIEASFNSPPTTSCGRLFDAVAATLGLCTQISYEGQAAIELEALITPATLARHTQGYAFDIDDHATMPRLDPKPMWRALLVDMQHGAAPADMAARFHLGLAQAIGKMVQLLSTRHGNPWYDRVALSGGVFQNAVLCEALITRLEADGKKVFGHHQVPANDGGLSLGQAVIAAAQLLHKPSPTKTKEAIPCV